MSDCEIPEFYEEHFRTARKRHQCCECFTSIDPGDRYVACVGKWDGDVSANKQHLVCYHVARFVNLDLFAEWVPARHARLTSSVMGLNDELASMGKSIDPYDGCIEFGGVKEALHAAAWKDEPFGAENCVDVLGYWMRWLSGVKETFSEGAGI